MHYAKENLNLKFNYLYYSSLNKNETQLKDVFTFLKKKDLQHFDKLSDFCISICNYKNSLQFRVIISQQNTLKNVFCYPNPTNQITHFSFEHERVGDDLAISIEIYDSNGRTIKQIHENVYKITSPYDQILWNISEDSNPIVTGNYFYRIFAKSLTSNYQATGIGRIVSVK